MKKALIVGCNGQDGRYLAQLLEVKGYQVSGIDRDLVLALPQMDNVDIKNPADVHRSVGELRPDEIYFLAAYHHSSEDVTVDDGELIRRSFEINTLALNNFLEVIAERLPQTRLFYAASSHVFGDPSVAIQDEDTPLNPINAYGISKAAGIHLCRYYRQVRSIFACAGILYNHESPRRTEAFISRKVVKAAVRISRHLQNKLTVGNLDAMVDWGYAPDYVDAMWRILQLQAPEDFVVSSGAMHSVKDLIATAFETVGLDWNNHVEVGAGIARRPQATLRGNSAKLTNRTGWAPSISFVDMIRLMVQQEIQNDR